MKVRNNTPKMATFMDSLGMCFFDGTYSRKQKEGSTDIKFHDYIDSVRNPDEDHIRKVELIRRVKQCHGLDAIRQLKIPGKILLNHKTKEKIYGALKWSVAHVYPSCQFDKKGCRVEKCHFSVGYYGV